MRHPLVLYSKGASYKNMKRPAAASQADKLSMDEDDFDPMMSFVEVRRCRLTSC